MADQNWLAAAFGKDFWSKPQPVKGQSPTKDTTVKKVQHAPGAVTNALQRRKKR